MFVGEKPRLHATHVLHAEDATPFTSRVEHRNRYIHRDHLAAVGSDRGCECSGTRAEVDDHTFRFHPRAALRQNAFGGAPLREIVKEELTRGKLPDGFAKPIAERVEASLQRRAGKQQKFSTYQSLTLPPSAFKWNTSDRVTMLTAAGRRTV